MEESCSQKLKYYVALYSMAVFVPLCVVTDISAESAADTTGSTASPTALSLPGYSKGPKPLSSASGHDSQPTVDSKIDKFPNLEPSEVECLKYDQRYRWSKLLKKLVSSNGHDSKGGRDPSTAALILGLRYALGEGAPQDYAKGFSLLAERADKGDLLASALAAKMIDLRCVRGVEISQAVDWLKSGVEKGDPESQFGLARLYYTGDGVPKSYEAAAALLTEASPKGHAASQSTLGYMYGFGIGVPKNYSKAISLTRKAAEQGDIVAQNNLGYTYCSDMWGEKDCRRGLMWAKKSVGEGYPKGMNCLGLCYSLCAKDYGKAAEWFRKAAKHGYENAKVELGKLHVWGYGAPKDYTEARRLFYEGQGRTKGQAEFWLGIMAINGLGREESPAEAAGWYEDAAYQGSVEAQYRLGILFEKGEGVDRDMERARHWYRKAAEMAHPKAEAALERLKAVEP